MFLPMYPRLPFILLELFYFHNHTREQTHQTYPTTLIMCNDCRPRANPVNRPIHHSSIHNSNRNPFTTSSQQWQALEFPTHQNHALTATQTQTCHHHTQTQSQTLTAQPCDTLTWNANTSCQPYSSALAYPNHQECRNNQPTFEILLHDLLDHAIRNLDTTQDCNTCRTLVCHLSSRFQSSPQQCNICATDQQQVVSLLLSLIERINTTTTQSHSHNHRTQTQCCSHGYSSTTNIMNSHRHQRTRCTCRTRCETCTTTHEQTKTLFDVLFRITRRRTSNLSTNRSPNRSQDRTVQVSNRYRRCSHNLSINTTNDTALCRLIRRVLDEIESGEGSGICCCQMIECQEYVSGNVRRLRKIVREIERVCDEGDGENFSCGCGCGVESYEMSRTTTTYDEPERGRPRVGNFHVGWML